MAGEVELQEAERADDGRVGRRRGAVEEERLEGDGGLGLLPVREDDVRPEAVVLPDAGEDAKGGSDGLGR